MLEVVEYDRRLRSDSARPIASVGSLPACSWMPSGAAIAATTASGSLTCANGTKNAPSQNVDDRLGDRKR